MKADQSLLTALIHSLLLRDQLQADISRLRSQLTAASMPQLSQNHDIDKDPPRNVANVQPPNRATLDQIKAQDEAWELLDARRNHEKEREKDVSEREKEVGKRETWVLEEMRWVVPPLLSISSCDMHTVIRVWAEQGVGD